MATRLNAKFLYAQIENDVIMVGFADDEFETKDYVLLQKSLIFNEQDKELGFDKVHITYQDELYSKYGGIQKIVLDKGVCEILLDSKTGNILGTGEKIEILFPNDFDLSDVKNHLEQMFIHDTGSFVSKI